MKSSTKVKEEHIPGVGIQYYVLRDAGVEIDRVFLTHLNNQYVYDGNELDLRDLFTSSDLTDEALRQKEEIPRRLAELNEMLARDEPPDVIPSRHCKTPYLCEFWEHCAREDPEHPVWELAGIAQKKLDELSAMGIMDIRDIPGTFPLAETQDRIRTCVKNNEEFVGPDLKRELEDVAYPAHFLDFERRIEEFKEYYKESLLLAKKEAGRYAKRDMLLLMLDSIYSRDVENSVRLLGAVHWFSIESKRPISPLMKRSYDRTEIHAHKVLDDAKFEIIFVEVQNLSLDAAIDLGVKIVEEL